jgi:hypothetical protein
MDPNEKFGPAGYGSQSFIVAASPFPYRITFENDPSATAPAQRVDITDQLDSDLDWRTVQFTGVGFGDTNIIIPPNSQYFQTTVDMTYNNQTFQVVIDLNLETATGKLTAAFQSINPRTSLPPDVLTGFLPPEDGTGRGNGYISYIVQPKADLATGTQIKNVALITFDLGETIATNQVDEHDPSQGTDPAKEALNTIDAGRPTSAVTPLPAEVTMPGFTVAWGGSDDVGGSGIGSYDIYVATDGGDFRLWLPGTDDTSGTYPGVAGHTYAFYSLAVDNVGHRQDTPLAPATTTVVVTNIWHNYAIPYDVDGNGRVEPLDVLLVINYINAHPGSTAPPASPESPARYYDVADGPDGDGQITPLDVLTIINYINAHPTGAAEGETSARTDSADPAAFWNALGADEDVASGRYDAVLAAGTPLGFAASRHSPEPTATAQRSQLALAVVPGNSGRFDAFVARPADRLTPKQDTASLDAWLDLLDDIGSDLAADVATAWRA